MINNLKLRALLGLVFLIFIMGVVIFLSAGSLSFRNGWYYLANFGLCVTVISFYFLKKDPDLVARRMNAGPIAEKEKNQKIIQSFAQVFFIGMLVLPGIDYRFSWSQAPLLVVILANILVLVAYGIVFWVFMFNSFSSSTIEVSQAQTVTTGGPYKFVRHPMYLGAGLMILASPLAMGSYWGVISSFLLMIVIVFRLLDEEKYLSQNLKGYPEYCQKTRYHLIPWIW